MSETIGNVFELLKKNPGTTYVSPDGLRLYALTGDRGEMLLVFRGEFTGMTDAEINDYIVKKLAEV